MMEFPRALKAGGAGSADGHRQWRRVQEAYHGAEPQAKRSPKERSAVPGTVTMVSQVALDDLGIVAPPGRPRRRLGSGQQDRGGMGTDLGPFGSGAGLPMPSARALSNQQQPLRVSTDANRKMTAAPAYTTRAQADPRRQLVETMAAAAYERSRPQGSSRPPWPETLDQWRQDSRDQMEAAIVAAQRAGWRIER